MDDEVLQRIIAAIAEVAERYRAGDEPRDEFEAELYAEMRALDGLIVMVDNGEPLTVPDFVPAEWLSE